MEEYPEELRTPPVALAALVGCPELHSSITAHLHGEQPPINALALPDFSKISLFSRVPKENPQPGRPIGGILKRDWLFKHRTKVPAVVAALFSSDHVSGDPAQWLQVCTDLENLKYGFLLFLYFTSFLSSFMCGLDENGRYAVYSLSVWLLTHYLIYWNLDRGVIKGRNIRLVVVVVNQTSSKGMLFTLELVDHEDFVTTSANCLMQMILMKNAWLLLESGLN